VDYSRSKHEAVLALLGPQLFNQPKGLTMQAPLKVEVKVVVTDATGAEVYSAAHAWSGMSEETETLLLATLHNAVTNAGLEKARAKGNAKP